MSSVSSLTLWNQRFRTVSNTEGLNAARSDSVRGEEGSVMIRSWQPRYCEKKRVMERTR